MRNVLLLESVRSCMDEFGNVYPLNCDGSPDFMITCHLDDQDKEFWDTMSDEDAADVAAWMV
tara:strand:+ start:435 stop:620 length:186 start_codon:yes stop_codon:yes gene_type:complete